ncbi:MAG: hypothetical protein M3Y32_14510 [Pseudomonadota bacterium]|nr:hypothetical protein [Pseudomonadota bacterium]
MREIVFKGKEYVYNHHLTVPYRPLVVHADKGVGASDLSGNLVIQGDNLSCQGIRHAEGVGFAPLPFALHREG